MKALFISNDPSIFDPASPARARMRAYADAIGELSILSRGAGEEVHEGNLHLYPHAGKLLALRTLAKRARALIEERGIDVVSAQDPFEHGRAALIATQGTPAKLHIQVHTDFLSPWFVRSGNWRSPRVRMPFLNRVRVRIADRVLPHADGIRAVSKRVAASLTERYGARIPAPSVIPIPMPSEAPAHALLPPHRFTFALIAVGRLEPEKRIEDIIHALARVALKYPMAGLFIAGEGRERARLEALAAKLGLGERVIFLGARSDAWALMESAQAFIQASAYEGYGRTLVEAALARVPIITTDVGIVGETFKGYEDVLSAPVADPTALAYHIIGLIEDTAVRQQLPMHAQITARAHLAALHNSPQDIAADLAKTLV